MILDKIVAHKRKTLEGLKEAVSLAGLEKSAQSAEKPRGFGRALRQARGMAQGIAQNIAHNIALIAEVKRASPSAGVIRECADPAGIARIYEAAGASAVSVLTDEQFFGGSLSDLRAVKEAVSIPVFRKDFILDPWQVYEARANGADGILLIAEILSDEEMRSLLNLSKDLGMDPMVEVHTEDELKRAVRVKAEIIGINNRNLHTFQVDLATTIGLVAGIPDGVLCVSESGIQNRQDVVRLEKAHVDAILVGTALMKETDMTAKIHSLLGKAQAPA